MSFPLLAFFFFFFNFSFNYENYYLKKKKSWKLEGHLMEKDNWVLMEDYIDKNWNLKDWNDKAES